MINFSGFDPASYRDPAGRVFYHEGDVYRQITTGAGADFDRLMTGGAYEFFTGKGWLIPHTRSNHAFVLPGDTYAVIKPDLIPFVSYASEWSFSMFKDAALLTLLICKEALRFDLILKDASPTNIQWHKGRLVFIDTLSFTEYDESKPWVAYRQFCECFLAPLLLMHYAGQPIPQLLLAYPDGIPIQTAASLLPRRAKFSVLTYLHVFLHAKIARRSSATASSQPAFSRKKLINILDSLTSLIHKLSVKADEGKWLNYYDEAATREGYLDQKKQIVDNWLRNLPEVQTVIDLGANEGVFAELAAAHGKQVLAVDMDAQCIDRLYQRVTNKGIKNVQPIVNDLSQPTPPTGFGNMERPSFTQRCKADLLLALALLHHLCIGKSIPVIDCARLFAGSAPLLILEFIPPDDAKVIALKEQKGLTFPDYNRHSVLEAFSAYFTLHQHHPIGESGRELWLLRKNTNA